MLNETFSAIFKHCEHGKKKILYFHQGEHIIHRTSKMQSKNLLSHLDDKNYDKSRSEFNELKLINGSPRIKPELVLLPFNSWLSLKLDWLLDAEDDDVIIMDDPEELEQPLELLWVWLFS